MSRLFQSPTFQNPVNSFHSWTNMKDCYIDPFVSTKYVYFGLPPPAFHSFHSWVCQTAPDGTLRHLRGIFKQTHCNIRHIIATLVIHIAWLDFFQFSVIYIIEIHMLIVIFYGEIWRGIFLWRGISASLLNASFFFIFLAPNRRKALGSAWRILGLKGQLV